MKITSESDMANISVGDTFQSTQFGPSGRTQYLCHVVAVIDEDMIAYKWYGKHKQWWHYEIECRFLVMGKIERSQRILEKEKDDAN